jgi:micrococcal nuclease
LLLVDTPESVKPGTPVQPYAKKASNFVKSKIKPGDTVKLEIGKPDKDKYDRLLAYVFVDGKNLNKMLLEKGLARVAYVYPPNTRYLDVFEKAQETAKDKKRNIWRMPGYADEEGFHPDAMINKE